jgi:8-oxo-dGTP pyrophosphatase MutT (NUDIX family)
LSDTSTEFSAGGVVVRDGDVAVIVPIKRGLQNDRVLGLPKGHPDRSESAEQAATREVREETGIDAELVSKLGEVRYWYQRKGKRIFKRVVFFLFEYRSGDLADHDREVEEARWISLEEASRTLTYAGEREMVARAMSRVAADR